MHIRTNLFTIKIIHTDYYVNCLNCTSQHPMLWKSPLIHHTSVW